MGILFRAVLFIFLISTPAHADDAPGDAALADKIAAEISAALEGEPYTVVKTCEAGNCVITLQME